jgi:WD repeat-containing protein 17
LVLDHKTHKHILRPEDNIGMPKTHDHVRSLEWDPLSEEYLLVATAQCTISLVDAISASILMCFEQPNATAEVQTLAWINTAPGMFVTGG